MHLREGQCLLALHPFCDPLDLCSPARPMPRKADLLNPREEDSPGTLVWECSSKYLGRMGADLKF